jgi:hypothetical protein
MKARLIACPTCARHIRLSEACCPFCGVTCSDGFKATPAPVRPPPGLNRVELYYFKSRTVAGAVRGGVALVTALSAASCGGLATGVASDTIGPDATSEILDALAPEGSGDEGSGYGDCCVFTAYGDAGGGLGDGYGGVESGGGTGGDGASE